jgi:CheY-specific phosphatase CheX
VPESSLNSTQEVNTLVGVLGDIEGNMSFGFSETTEKEIAAKIIGKKVEDINKDTTNRRAADVVRICTELGIQVFNIGKADGPKRLLEHISKF